MDLVVKRLLLLFLIINHRTGIKISQIIPCVYNFQFYLNVHIFFRLITEKQKEESTEEKELTPEEIKGNQMFII
jgi:hypothetical protein